MAKEKTGKHVVRRVEAAPSASETDEAVLQECSWALSCSTAFGVVWQVALPYLSSSVNSSLSPLSG